MSLADGCRMPVPPPTEKYDFLVTIVPTTSSNPYAGRENEYSMAINGVDGAKITLDRGRSYIFYAQVSCNHPFFIATTVDNDEPPFSVPFDNVINQHACLHANPLVTLVVDDTTPSELFYACSFHNWMGGNITIPSNSIPNPPTAHDYRSDVIGLGVSVGVLATIILLGILFLISKKLTRRGGYQEVRM